MPAKDCFKDIIDEAENCSFERFSEILRFLVPNGSLLGAYDDLSKEELPWKMKTSLESPAFNAVLLSRYPFLGVHYLGTCTPFYEDEDDSSSYYSDIPYGWRRRFGLAICEDIRNILLETGDKSSLGKYRIDQIKEKFGDLRWYDGYDGEIDPEIFETLSYVVELYSTASAYTCVECGSFNVKTTSGWIIPICKSCYVRNAVRHSLDKKKEGSKYVPYADRIATAEKEYAALRGLTFDTSLPIVMTRYSRDGEEKINLTERYLDNGKYLVSLLFKSLAASEEKSSGTQLPSDADAPTDPSENDE